MQRIEVTGIIFVAGCVIAAIVGESQVLYHSNLLLIGGWSSLAMLQ